MEMLRATYGSDSEEDDADDSAAAPPIVGSRSSSGSSRSKADSGNGRSNLEQLDPLPPPPLDLLQSPNVLDSSSTTQGSRIRSFPHVEGNYALHVYVPVVIPTTMKMPVALFVKRIASLVPGVYAVDIDYPLAELCRDDLKLEQMLLGREFHVSLGRTVPIKVHQIDSIVAMLRQKFQSQRRYRVEFNKWDVFVNDEQTRSFLALEVLGGGLSEITKQIHIVDVIYRLHGLPEFYKNPRPHISLLWGLGDMSDRLKQGVEEIDRSYKNASLSCGGHIFTCKTSGIECKIGFKVKGDAVPDTNYCCLCENSCTEDLPIWSVGRENISFLVKSTLFENLYHSHPDICLGFLRNPNLSDACNPTSCILVLINCSLN